MLPSLSDPLWFKNAVFYEIPVRAFSDWNGDGIGDFRGLIDKLDYLQWLGVDCLWLLPFYPSPLRDDGYDIADFRAVSLDYGSLEDFRELLDEAHSRGMRVLADLVLNHTSDQHAWFQQARSSPESPYRNWYVWSSDPHRYRDARIIFVDSEMSNWTWDPVANAYYWHRFYSHQPDLNFDEPAVRQAMLDIVYFWLDLGLDGFRCDAVPYLFEREHTSCENLPETHAFLQELRRGVDARYGGDRVLLAEANQWPSDVVRYFGQGPGQGPEFHMAFHFPLMPRLFMAVRQETRRPIVDILTQTPAIPANCQWGLFLRNHDELTLEMCTDEERDYMYYEYAREPRMKLNIGIRRRLAPIVDNSRREMELMNALLFSMPGAPIVYYGDEIGMGDNIYLSDRNGVRTPMQWNVDRNGGFSKAPAERLYAPPIQNPIYSYHAINVERQFQDPNSLLNWMRELIQMRHKNPMLGWGTLTFLAPGNERVLAFLRRLAPPLPKGLPEELPGARTMLIVANLSRSSQAVELDLSSFAGWTPQELFGGAAFPAIGTHPYQLSLGPYGYFWFQLEPPSGSFDGAPA